MNCKIILHESAKDDIVELADYLSRESSLSIAENFVRSAKDSFLLLSQMPGIGKRYVTTNSFLSDLRIWPIQGFEKHLIFYRCGSQCIEIIRVFHCARDIPTLLDGEPNE